ncbi:radical SAM domain protein [Cryptobacterium sp. CAG:338]|nr:radical SAM domain protein [Cryptobacterium sp. CAG:338]
MCPRACGVNRAIGELGVCKAPAELRIGRAALHWWEEPCLVGEQGSGAVFFSYCPLGCVYCQNEDLVAGAGIEVGFEQLKQTLLRLQNEEHAANINLVTPSHYVPTIAEALRQLRKVSAEEFSESNVVNGGSSGDRLVIPVVYNTSSYDSVESLRLLKGLVDIYLADFKYVSPEVARKLSHAANYPEVALVALDEMVAQVGFWSENAQGLLEKGIIVRHLVLPGHIEESFQVLRVLHERYGNKIRLSIMNQYTPLRGDLVRYGLSGKVSNEEYESVLDYADYLGIEDYFWQEGGAATESFIPTFDGTGVISK